MFVKLNIVLICVALLNFGECNNCDDVFKCVTTWVGDVLSPKSNVTLDDIENLSANISTSNKSLDNNDSFLANLSRVLLEKISSLIKDGPSLKTFGEKTKIYVQSFKINESASVYKPTVKIINSDVGVNHEKNTNIHDNPVFQIENIIDNENSTLFSYENNFFDDNATLTTKWIFKNTTTVSDMTDQNSSDKSSNGISENTNYNLNYINKHEIVTTSICSNIVTIQETNENIKTTTEFFSGVPGEATKKLENNDSDKNSPVEINNIIPQAQTKEKSNISEEINIKDNYIEGMNDLLYGTNNIDITEIVHDNLTDYLDIDYVDMYKDTTNEDVDYTPAVYIPTTTAATKIITDKKPIDGVDSVYPWIATVFVMNPESKQFAYICDGSILSERVVLTAARCLLKNNIKVDAANILIILGKRSLQSTGPNEKVLRVKSIKIYDNFVSTEGKVDLAIAVLAEPAVFNVDIHPAPLGIEDKSAPLATATTGWHVSGPLQPLYLGRTTENSRMDVNCSELFCATLSDSETTCPSYGGLLIERQDDDQWRLKGIASGSPMTTGVCFNKHLIFTKIGNYLDWIKKNIQETSSK